MISWQQDAAMRLYMRYTGDRERRHRVVKDKMMLELFQLVMAAMEDTEDYVHIEIGNYGFLCSVMIMEGGFQERKKYDGWYDLVSGDGELEKEMRMEEFLKAKEHLKRLIEKARRDRLEVAV